MYSSRRLIPVALVMGLAAACGPLRRGGPAPARIIFMNQSLDQADVYAISSGGAQTRIGTVMPGRTDTLRIPGSAMGADNSTNVVARILARSRTPSTGRFTVVPGDLVQVTLNSDERILSVLPAREP
jgi:hypothetical protein